MTSFLSYKLNFTHLFVHFDILQYIQQTHHKKHSQILSNQTQTKLPCLKNKSIDSTRQKRQEKDQNNKQAQNINPMSLTSSRL